MRTVVCIPFLDSDPHRAKNYEFVREWWDWSPWDVYVDDGGVPHPMNRSAARNGAAREAGDWDVAIFADADTVGQARPVEDAVARAAELRGLVWPFDRFEGLSREGTVALKQGRPLPNPVRRRNDSPGGILAVHRSLYELVGGWDEGFRGWGYEDVAFVRACMTLGTVERLPGIIRHLWHPKSPEYMARKDPGWQANYARSLRYKNAEGSVIRMTSLLREFGLMT